MRLIIALLLLLSISSCGFIEANTVGLFFPEPEAVNLEGAPPAPPPTKTEPAPVLIEKLNDSSVSQVDDIEILWKVPEQPVDGFVIHYGNANDQLDKELRVEVTELKKIEHPQFGTVYRYLLKSVARGEKLFVSISAYSDTLVSDHSAILEVK